MRCAIYVRMQIYFTARQRRSHYCYLFMHVYFQTTYPTGCSNLRRQHHVYVHLYSLFVFTASDMSEGEGLGERLGVNVSQQ